MRHNFCPEVLCRVLFDELALPATAGFAVAYSGGCDSTVLLHALWRARQQGAGDAFTVTALHFDHGLDSHSADWAKQCEAQCQDWGIDFVSAREAPDSKSTSADGGIEAHARRRRYRWFAQAVKPGQILLTAHHANDQAETVLLNLLRGSGLGQLAGIPRRRTLCAEKSTLVARPLLAFPREVLAEYARANDLSWIEDPANRSPAFDRNYLRQSVIPALETRWPAAVAALGRAAGNCREAAEYLDAEAQRTLSQCQAKEKRGVFCLDAPLAVAAVQPLGQFRVINLLRHWLHRHSRPSPSSGQLATFYTQVFESADEHPRAGLRWDDTELRCFAGYIYLLRSMDTDPDAARAWDLQNCTLGKNHLRVEVRNGGKEASNAIDPQRLHGKSLQWVWRTGGERMTLPGRKHSSALKKLLQQNEAPPWERAALPLLTADGEVAWAYGIGAADLCCVNRDAEEAEGKGGQGVQLRFVIDA